MTVFVGDPGVDDAIALAVLAGAEAAGEQVDLDLVVASAGNVDVETAAEVAARMVAALGFNCPVQAARGLRVPPRLDGPGEEPFHGADGLGGQLASLPPASRPADYVPERLAGADVLATGPLSAVATAVEAGHRPWRILWMGGAVRGGNVTATAEFNAWCDPFAADLLLTSGIPVAVVPIDVTHQVRLSDADLARWRDAGSTSAVLAEAFAAMTRRGERTPHDAVAAVAWLRPELFGWEPRTVRCDSGTERLRGTFTVGEVGGTVPTQLAVDVDAAAVHDAIVAAVATV